MKAAQTLARAVKVKRYLREASGIAYDAIVHATPLGMYPKVDGMPLDGVIPRK